MLMEAIEKGVDTEAVRWQARVDLAAAHRLAVLNGFQEGIANHMTLRVPATTDRYYQAPYGLHWSEVTASCFMEVGYDGALLAGKGEIERSCYSIHAPIHKRVSNAEAVFHTHMPFASALARLEKPEILPIGQIEVSVALRTAYDYDYDGPAEMPSEGDRLAGILGDKGDKNVLIMSSHGVLTLGRSVAEAFDNLYYIERVAQVQLYAMWTGQPLKHLSQDIIDESIQLFKALKPYGNKKRADWHFEALKRMLDRPAPDYRS